MSRRLGFLVEPTKGDDEEEEGDEEEYNESLQVGDGHHEFTPDFVKSALELRAEGARYVKMGECEVTFDKQRKAK